MFRFSIRDVLWLTVVVGVNVVVACFFYETAGWYYIRDYREVVTDLIYPPIILQSIVNLILTAIYCAISVRRQSERHALLSLCFFVCAVLVGLSLYPAPTVGKWLNNNLLLPTPLIEAALYGDAPVVIALVNRGADPNIRHVALATTPLHYMASWDKPEAVKVLLTHGANPNLRDGFGRTPLYNATLSRAKWPTIKLLVDAGADPFAKDMDGHTPVYQVYNWAPEYPGRTKTLNLMGITVDDDMPWRVSAATPQERDLLKAQLPQDTPKRPK